MGAARQLAAVWFADIVGFTTLSSRDEDAAMRAVEALQISARNEIEQHGGVLVKHLGDGVLARFDSTVTAIHAALALRDAFRDATRDEASPVSLRFGLHVGDIVQTPSGDVLGDGVNVASRILQEARPGGIVVSEDVQRQCRQRPEIRFVALGSRRLRGLDEPLDVYEVVPTGEEVPGVEPVAPSPAFDRRRMAIGGGILAALLIAAYLGLRGFGGPEVVERSIAVLPFQTVGSEKASAFTEGIQLGVLTRLAGVSGLKVISRTSVAGFAESNTPVPQIARELGVGWVIRGDVQEVDAEVLVHARLIDAREDRQVWAAEYRHQLTAERIFDIQAQIAFSIIAALETRLTSPQEARIARVPTENLEAYRLYVQGREMLDTRTESGVRQALAAFESAIARDSTYAHAWVGVADALALLYSYRYADADTVLPTAERAVRRALQLDSGLAEGYASLGLLQYTYGRGLEGLAELERAVSLRPSYAEAHNWLSYGRLLLGLPAKALESSVRAVELDPLSPETVSNLAFSRLASGQVESALTEARRTTALEPAWTTGPFYEGLALHELGRFSEAAAVLRGLEVPWAGEGPAATRALALIAMGDSAGARALLARIEEAEDGFAAGLVLAALGDAEAAAASFRQTDAPGDWPNLAVRYLYGSVWRRLDPSVRQDLLARIDRRMGRR